MQHIVPIDRHQVSFSSLEELVAPDDPVRFLDAFAEKLDLSKLGFKTKAIQPEGRPILCPTHFIEDLFVRLPERYPIISPAGERM